jgi:hypothetical protein
MFRLCAIGHTRIVKTWQALLSRLRGNDEYSIYQSSPDRQKQGSDPCFCLVSAQCYCAVTSMDFLPTTFLPFST